MMNAPRVMMYQVHYIFIYPNDRTKRGLDLLTHRLLETDNALPDRNGNIIVANGLNGSII